MLLHWKWNDFDSIRLKLWAQRLTAECPLLIAMLGDNIIVGSWNHTDGTARWCELDIPASDTKLSGADAAYIAELSARTGGASFRATKQRKSDGKWLDLARCSALMLSFSRVIKLDGKVYQHKHFNSSGVSWHSLYIY